MRNNLGGVCPGGESRQNKTGDWRYFRPMVRDNCNLCGLCELFCPDSSIVIAPEHHKAVIDYEYCKGCGICANECPRGAIAMEEEKRGW